jgi:hypothetical protein
MVWEKLERLDELQNQFMGRFKYHSTGWALAGVCCP